MKKKTIALLGALGAAGAWCVHRNKKYPLAKGYGAFNKVAIPGAILNEKVAKFANSIMAGKDFRAMPNGVTKERIQFDARDRQTLTLSVYWSEDIEKNSRCLIYFHGGGFFLKDEAYIHKLVCQYADKVKCTVIFVHYRTADEYPFPVPFYDCCDAIEYVWNHTEHLGIDKHNIALGGDSAGGALAASCAHWCKAQGISICFQMLVYPVIDSRMETETSKKYKDVPLWNSSLSKRMWEIYLRNGISEKDEYASPALATDFSHLPPAFIEVSEFDSLYDEGLAYAACLKDAGVNVETSILKGSFHGFDILSNTELTKEAVNNRCCALSGAFRE